MNWHPRITFYRLTVILSTIWLGTAKAVNTYQGREFISITIDWIMGVVIYLLLFATSIYDSEDRRPKYCANIFKRDLLDLLWALLESKFSFQRPRYISHELSIPATDDSGSRPHLRITHYRFIVSVFVFSFGTFKAMLAYQGDQTGAHWMDWAFATVVTSILYTLGLYETDPIRNSQLLIPIDTASHPHPRVTYYRLLICIVIFSFGAFKAILACLGYQTEENWMDWAFGVGATSILYTLGLYEKNSLRLWSGFFVVDRRRELADFLRAVVVYVIVPFLCIWWAKTTTGWYIQYIWYCPPDYGEPYTLIDAIAKGGVLSPWYLILMGGGITAVVCTATGLIPGLYDKHSLHAWSEFFDRHRKLAKILSIITNAMVPVLCIWWVTTTIGWFFRFWNEPGWETFLNVYWRLPVPLNLVLVFYFNIALFFYILLLMGGGVAGVVSCGVCLTAWLKAEL